METNIPATNRFSGARGCFSVIADRSLEAIVVIDMKGVVHYTNAAWVRMHGYENRNEVVGKPISTFHKEQIPAEISAFLRGEDRRGQINGLVGHIHKNGTEIPTHSTMVALKDETGKWRGVIIFAANIGKPEQPKEDVGGLKREAPEQTESLKAALAGKEKQVAELTKHLQLQKTEQIRLEQQWTRQYREMTHSIDELRQEVKEMKHQEVEYLDGIDEDAELIGASGKMNREQLRELSDMAKKFAGN